MNPIRRKLLRRNDAQRVRSKRGVEVRRMMRECAAEAIETSVCGTVTFDGPMFGGRHIVRIAAVSDGRPVMDFVVDGVMSGAKTVRGVRAAIARMIAGG